MAILEIANNYLRAELCVLPAIRDQKRPAVCSWQPFRSRLPTESELAGWFDDTDALCLVCGATSGNLEAIDFDLGGKAFPDWCELVKDADQGLLERLVIEQSPSGGWHVAYRCNSPVSGNLKLAQRKQVVDGPADVTVCGNRYQPRQGGDGSWYVTLTMIETRGEGGLFLCSPTPGYELIQGDFAQLPLLTSEERETLLAAAWELNEHRPEIVDIPTPGVGESRPGDEFNQRGDVRDVLRRHGWTLVRSGANEYWRRPGKTSGWSATLKDNVFYVHSANAAPFDGENAYSPFSVYALLEHSGDYSAAAKTLRGMGFGDESQVLGDVDLSKFVETENTVSVDPGPIPEELFHVPGFVADVMDFTLKNAPYPNVALAFCGAIALQSFLAGRKVSIVGDLRTNLYLLALASSGTGKEFPRKVNARVLFEAGLITSLGDKFASGEGIQDALSRTSSMLFQNDEMDGVLRQVNLDQESKRESIPNVLLTLYTSASDVYPIRVKAGQKEAIHVDQPHLTLFGTATPQHFYESLSKRMLTNGFFARLCIIDVGHRGVGQTPGSARDIPERVLEIARWWANYHPGKGNLQSFHPDPYRVSIAPDAQEAITRLQRLGEAEYDRADQANDEVGRTAWSRTCENAQKLALVYACSQSHEKPRVGLDAVEWATEFAMHQTRRQLFLAATYVAENPFHADCLKLMRKLNEFSGQAARRKLMRAMRCKSADFDQLVSTLIEQGEIVPVIIPTKTKPAQGYKIVSS